MKKKILMAFLMTILVFSSSVFVSADGSSVLKSIYGDNAPQLPLIPEMPENNIDWSDEDAVIKLAIPDTKEWDSFFDYLEANDPGYSLEKPIDDRCGGDYTYILAELEAEDAVSYSGMSELSDKLTDTFVYYLEKYTGEYNSRVKDGTTYVTEDMRAVSVPYTSFASFERVYVSGFNTDMECEEMAKTLQTLLDLLEMGSDVKVEKTEENCITATYRSDEYDSDYNKVGSDVKLECITYPEQNGCGFYSDIKASSDGSVLRSELFEFRKLDENLYAVQTNKARLVAEFDGENIGNFKYSVLKNEDDVYSRAADSMFSGSASLTDGWTVRKDISAYSIAAEKSEEDYMKVSNGGKYYTIYIEN